MNGFHVFDMQTSGAGSDDRDTEMARSVLQLASHCSAVETHRFMKLGLVHHQLRVLHVDAAIAQVNLAMTSRSHCIERDRELSARLIPRKVDETNVNGCRIGSDV